MKCVVLFTIDDLYDGNGRKTSKYTKIQNWLESAEMEVDCFPVSENTENKPDKP